MIYVSQEEFDQTWDRIEPINRWPRGDEEEIYDWDNKTWVRIEPGDRVSGAVRPIIYPWIEMNVPIVSTT